MTGFQRSLVLHGLVGVVLVGIGIALSLNSDYVDNPGVSAAILATLMSTYIGVGLYAWWRRPANRFGMLMAAAGFAAFAQALTAANSALFFSIGVLFSSVYIVVAIHMLLAFPTGRIPTAGQRRLVIAAYTLSVVAPLFLMLFERDADNGDDPVPGNVFFVTEAHDLFSVLDVLSSLVGVVIIGGIAVVLVRRWRASGPRDRYAMAPLLWTGAALIAMLAALLAADAFVEDSAILDAIDWVALAFFAALPFAFLTGLLRSRAWRAGALTELVESLSVPQERWTLRDALAEALGDPALQLAYALEEPGQYVDEQGRPVVLPGDDDPARAATEVEREDRVVGALIHDRALCDEPELVRAVAVAAALAMDNERLDAELRARVDELRRSRQRLLDAGLAERRRLERDLHDGAQQRLVSLALQLGLVSQQLDRDPQAARELLAGARTEARAALEDLRELARGIHPAVLTDRGLGAALEALADRTPLPVEVRELPAERLPPAVEAAAYFVVAESLTNIVKYARATYAEVSVTREHGWALVEVRDDGVGGADPSAGTGLRGLADRLAALDGRLEIESAPGRGTRVRARVPCTVEVTA